MVKKETKTIEYYDITKKLGEVSLDIKTFVEQCRTDAIRYFVKEILHGSEDHQKWLTKAGENYIKGDHVSLNNPYKK